MGTWNFGYDALNRLSKGTLAQFSCDMNPGDSAFNGFQPSNDYVLGLGGEQAAEMGVGGSTDGSATSGLVWLHSNIWAGGTLLGTYDGGAGIISADSTYGLHFYFDDPLGTRRVQTDYAGVVEQTCQSLPYGDGETCAATPTENLFTGKERDAETNNDYFEARYYRSALGRFMSPDWSAQAEPVPYAKMGDPQSLNLYAYMMNSPLGGVDADGHDPAWDDYNLNSQAGGCGARITAADCGATASGEAVHSGGESGAPLSSVTVATGGSGQQQNSNGTSLPSSLAMTTGPSIGGIISTVKKLFGFGKDAKDMLDAKEQYSFWGTMQKGHLAMRDRDMSNSKYADPMHIGVDIAHLKLDEAEMSYYGTKMALTAGGASGGIMFPQLGDGVLFQLKTQIDAAAQNLAAETAAYNRAVGAQ